VLQRQLQVVVDFKLFLLCLLLAGFFPSHTHRFVAWKDKGHLFYCFERAKEGARGRCIFYKHFFFLNLQKYSLGPHSR